MAEIISNKNKGRKQINIDLTPMVDLGFLLITFFMLATKLGESKALVIYSPDKGQTEKPMKYPEESTIQLLVDGYNGFRIYGKEVAGEGVFFNNTKALRKELLYRTLAAKQLPNGFSEEAHQLHVILKPTINCDYQQFVAAIDEMKICGIEQFAIVDASIEESELMTQLRQL